MQSGPSPRSTPRRRSVAPGTLRGPRPYPHYRSSIQYRGGARPSQRSFIRIYPSASRSGPSAEALPAWVATRHDGPVTSFSRARSGLLALLIVVLAAGPAHAKSFTLPEADVSVEILKDGSVRVTEHITYAFDGSFSDG